MLEQVNEFATEVCKGNAERGFWDAMNDATERGDEVAVNALMVEKLALVVSEVSEAIEELRAGYDVDEAYYREDGKPEGVPSELADVVIRVFDFAGYFGVDLEYAIKTKLEFNATRGMKHGKAF